jgi:hypothetical protein
LIPVTSGDVYFKGGKILREWYRENRARSFRSSQRVLHRQRDSSALTLRCSSMTPAISCLSRGEVSAGVRIFSPPRLLIQEPRGQQRQGLVMMPGDPVPHLVIGQARLPLAALQALLDPMRQLGHPAEFHQPSASVFDK